MDSTVVTTPMIIQMLLAAIIFLAVLVEIKTGGMGAGILLGTVAAGVFFGSGYVRGLVDVYNIALFMGGVLCIVAELLMPTVGLLAGAGVALMLYSIVQAMGGDINAMVAMFISMVIAILLFLLIVNKLPSSKLWKKVVLRDEATSARGFVSAEPRTSLVGRTGSVLTELRPSGSVLIDGKPVDVVSEGAYVTKGTQVVVIEAQGSRVVVRKQDN